MNAREALEKLREEAGCMPPPNVRSARAAIRAHLFLTEIADAIEAELRERDSESERLKKERHEASVLGYQQARDDIAAECRPCQCKECTKP